jgi:uncharacterized membrane protein
MWTTRTRIGWSLLLAGAVVMGLAAGRCFTFDPEVYFERQRPVYEAETLGLMVHITGMLLAVLAGPWQFLRRLRERHFGFHRALGKVYILGAIVGALGGLYMAQFSASGPVSDVAFALLALAVLLTTTVAFLRMRSGNVQSHREWMTRSYALVFSAVTLRLYVPSSRERSASTTATRSSRGPAGCRISPSQSGSSGRDCAGIPRRRGSRREWSTISRSKHETRPSRRSRAHDCRASGSEHCHRAGLALRGEQREAAGLERSLTSRMTSSSDRSGRQPIALRIFDVSGMRRFMSSNPSS